MSIEKLKLLVSPPESPFEVGSLEEWQNCEQKLGLTLPTDYQDFVFSYGSGLFANFYRIYNPFSASAVMNLAESVERVCEHEREIKKRWPKEVPYAIYPEPSGIVPCGNDENGNEYFWLAEGPPDTWQIISDEVRGEGFRQYGRTLCEFLCDVLTFKISARAGDYPDSRDRTFKPFEKEVS